MAHKHIYDKSGKQLCCTQQEKIYSKAGASVLLKEGHSEHDGHSHEEHSDDDGHDHSGSSQTILQMFLPAIISLILLFAAIAFDNWFPQAWFTGWVRIVWYAVAYLPVGFPVMKEAAESIRKGEIFSEFLLMSIATIGAFAIGEYPEGVAVMLFYAIGEVFQTLAVKRAKANIKTLLDQRPDEVTILDGVNAGQTAHITAISAQGTNTEEWTLDTSLTDLTETSINLNISPFKLIRKYTFTNLDELKELYFDIQNRIKGKKFFVKLLIENLPVGLMLELRGGQFIFDDLGVKR